MKVEEIASKIQDFYKEYGYNEVELDKLIDFLSLDITERSGFRGHPSMEPDMEVEDEYWNQ